MTPLLLSGNQVVYTMMEFGSMLLWDEASKKRFIDAVLEEKRRLGIEVYAFSIFGDRAFLLTGKFGAYTEEEACQDVLTILRHYLKTGRLTQDDHRSFQNGSNLKLSLCLLNGREKIVDALIYVHLVARDLGYVRAAFDYWWSSIQIYRNRPSWKSCPLAPENRTIRPFLSGLSVCSSHLYNSGWSSITSGRFIFRMLKASCSGWIISQLPHIFLKVSPVPVTKQPINGING